MCSECQDGCGGHMSNQCYDSEHSDGEFGICDCDGQCGGLLDENRAGDVWDLNVLAVQIWLL